MAIDSIVASEMKPTMPWQPTRGDRARLFLRLLISVVVTHGIVWFTPMKGKLAYFFVFIIFSTLIGAADNFRVGGKKAAQDSFVSALALTAGIIVFLPVASILLTTVSRGIKGFHKTLLTDTMAKASITDPISMGEIGRAHV